MEALAVSAADSCSKGLEECRNKDVALHLKITAIASILTACVLGVCMPLLGRSHGAFRAGSDLFFVVKSFAAGVILATGFVHMLPDAFDALNNPCLPAAPWSNFPFAGFVAMMAALVTLMIDFWGTAYYKRREQKEHSTTTPDKINASLEVGNVEGEGIADEENGRSLSGAASPITYEHPQKKSIHPDDDGVPSYCDSTNIQRNSHSDSHFHSLPRPTETDESSQLRQRVISQVLELGIVAHSVIIGISLGTSESPCTIRPLIAALTFHQFFEGIALGGCIAQAGFRSRAAGLMAFFFSVTTPTGIAIGIGIASVYNENSPKALIVEGLFDAMSAGILVYMSLVDLIAADFLSERMQNDCKLQAFSYVALFLGAGAMSFIAKWS